MRIKLDENLPASLAGALSNLGHEVHTLADEKLNGADDREVWQVAQREARFLITQDLDFSDLRQFAPGTHHGILLVRLQAPGRESLIRRVLDLFQTERVDVWAKCFVVVTEHKVRVVWPPN
jgi:predicted nuclease of predicted toxin-antitoxin system